MPPDIQGTLEHILDSADFITKATNGITFEQFASDRLVQSAVERHFEIIGEAVNRLRRHAPEFAERIGAANKAVGLRNVLIHGYDRIDYKALWQTIQEFLPTLRAEVDGLLRETEGQ